VNVGPTLNLPERGARLYLEYLRATRETILTNLADLALDGDAAAIVSSIAFLNRTGTRWRNSLHGCRGPSSTRISCKPTRASEGDKTASLFYPSTGRCGMGVPAIDLAQFSDHLLGPENPVSPDLSGIYRRQRTSGRSVSQTYSGWLT
jgi:hypothetical protein